MENILGVELLGHRGGSAHVAEQHRDHAPFPDGDAVLAPGSDAGAASRRSPQALQNLAPSGLSAPQAPQRVMGRTIAVVG